MRDVGHLPLRGRAVKPRNYFSVLLTVGVFVIPPTTTASGPGFSCEKAATNNEKLICKSPRLSELDFDLGRLYSRLVKLLGDDKAAQLRKAQRAWLKKRDTRCSSINCLEKIYEERIVELSEYGEGNGFGYQQLSRRSSRARNEENKYSWSKEDWQKYIYDEEFIRCGDDDGIARAVLDRVSTFDFDYKTRCLEPPEVDYGWYDLEWDKRPLSIIKLGTPNDHVILLTVPGTAASSAWDKTLVYKKSGIYDGAIVAEIIGWVTDPAIQTDEKIQFDTSDWRYDSDDAMCCPSYRVYTKVEITKSGIKVKERFSRPTEHD